MVPTLEAIRGGGGSIKVGTTGTISALMSKELESVKSLSTSSSVSSGNTKPRISKPKKSLPDEATSASSTSRSKNQKAPEAIITKRTRLHTASQIPMLEASDTSVDATPIRQKTTKRSVSVVEIVDIKCGSPDKAWVKSGLKKLGFSKLSENNV